MNIENDTKQISRDDEDRPSRRSFLLSLISDVLFCIASALYIYEGVLSFNYQTQVEDYPDGVFDADDDATWNYYGFEDDYVWKTPFT